MDSNLPALKNPRFRGAVTAFGGANMAEITLGAQRCSFEYSDQEALGVLRLLDDLRGGGLTVAELAARSPEIAEKIPPLLEELNHLRLLTESAPAAGGAVCSGAQLYREVRRVADRTLDRVGKSLFLRALLEDRATREQLIGYALEYHWIVKAAPGLIAPALANAHSRRARERMQDFLKSELGHDRYLASALAAAGVSEEEMELHQPLPATFALCAALGVYGRQHPLSFHACLFLFERAQPEFVDAFDDRCRDLGLPEVFYAPLRAHADLNEEFDHEDIAGALMELEPVVDAATSTVVKRHVSLMVETMVQQEEEILAFYGRPRDQVARVFGSRPVGPPSEVMT